MTQSKIMRTISLLTLLAASLGAEIAAADVSAGPAASVLSTPAIDQIRQRLQERGLELRPFFASGALGLNAAARLQIRDLMLIPLDARARVKQLVAKDNRDRDALYRILAEHAVASGFEPSIRANAVEEWIKQSPPGYWFEAEGWQKTP